MDVGAAVSTHGETFELVKPSDRALDDPTISTEPLGRLDASSRDARGDVEDAAGDAASREVVSLIGMQLRWSLAWTTARSSHGLDELQHRPELQRVVDVCRSKIDGEWDALRVDDQVVLRAWFSAVRRIRPRFFAPPFAGTLEASSAARDQSIASAKPSSSSNARCSRCQTPARCQSRKRRQQVMPLPQPISLGRCSHPMPVRSTKRMPANAARSGTRGRPPYGFGSSAGKSGAIRLHSSSGTIGFAMPGAYGSWPLRDKFC